MADRLVTSVCASFTRVAVGLVYGRSLASRCRSDRDPRRCADVGITKYHKNTKKTGKLMNKNYEENSEK